MATLQELLSQNDPDALKKLLGRTSTDKEDIVPDSNPDAIPTPGPTPILAPIVEPISNPMSSNLSTATIPEELEKVQPETNGIGPVSNSAEYAAALASLKQKPSLPVSGQPPVSGQEDGEITDAPPSIKKSEGFTNNTVEGLQSAQDETNRLKNLADLRSAAAMIMSGQQGLAHNTLPPSIEAELKLGESQKKGAEDITTQFKARGEQEKNDPASAASVQARQTASAMLKQAGMNINIPENVSAADLEKRFPQLQHMATAHESTETRKLIASEGAKNRAATKEEAADVKIQKRASDLNSKLVEEMASSRSPLGKAAIRKQNADAIEALINQFPDKGDIDNRQMYEIARSLDSMLSSGAATISGSEHLIPKTWSGDASKIAEYITGIPKGAKQRAFVERTLETIKRERDVAQKQIDTTKNKYLAGFDDVKEKAPKAYNKILETHGLDEKSKEATKAPTVSDMVKVISPEGKTGSIPKSKLQEALKRGFKEAK